MPICIDCKHCEVVEFGPCDVFYCLEETRQADTCKHPITGKDTYYWTDKNGCKHYVDAPSPLCLEYNQNGDCTEFKQK